MSCRHYIISEAGTGLHTDGHTQYSLMFTICASCKGNVHWPLEVNLSTPFPGGLRLCSNAESFYFPSEGWQYWNWSANTSYSSLICLSSLHTSWIYQKQGWNWKTGALQLKELCQRFVWGTQATFKPAMQAITYLELHEAPISLR